jgi:thioesterase domain-containing protein
MRSPYSKSFAQFPELVHFNNIYDGRPVFWLHGGVGGVESYKGVAKKSSRPFYGIEARGWMTEREPLHGIQAMAAYYTHIIQTVQPEGPYDLGGYSLGGVLANEVARQLQEMGQSINTIVMLDAPCYSEEVSMGTSKRKAMLSAANLALTTSIPDVEKLAKVLISRDEVSYIQDDDVFLDQLVTLALSRGVTKTEKQLYKFIRQCMKVQLAFEIDRASVLPLIDPTNIMCYYFRNKSGVFYGFLEPYYDYSDTAEKDTYE